MVDERARSVSLPASNLSHSSFHLPAGLSVADSDTLLTLLYTQLCGGHRRIPWPLTHRHSNQVGKPRGTQWKPRKEGSGLNSVIHVQNNPEAGKLLFSVGWDSQKFQGGGLKLGPGGREWGCGLGGENHSVPQAMAGGGMVR